MMQTDMPLDMTTELAAMGVIEPPKFLAHAPVVKSKKPLNQYPFRRPELDKNGEPPW